MNRILSFYFNLPHDKTLGIISKAFNRIMARICKRVLDRTVPGHFLKTQHQFSSGVNTSPRKQEVVVSLTSFPARIEEVWIVIECLFRQTYKADHIVLWLSKQQFPAQELPKRLLDQTQRGLDIRFVDEDLRSHKKYFYAFEAFPEAHIITVDDDVYYPNNMFSELITAQKAHPKCVIANRGHEIKFDKVGNILPYRKWEINKKSKKPSKLYMPTGVGGVLYPPNSYSHKIFDKDIFCKICYGADDIWLKINTLLEGRFVYLTDEFNTEFITVGKSQNEKLVSTNSLGGGNDQQLKEVLKYFNIENLKQFQNLENNV